MIKQLKSLFKTAKLKTLVFLGSFLPVFAQANDLFANGKQTVADSFGQNSTVIWILYVLEILAAVFMYIKTKNLAVFGGIAAIIIFVNVVFGLI